MSTVEQGQRIRISLTNNVYCKSEQGRPSYLPTMDKLLLIGWQLGVEMAKMVEMAEMVKMAEKAEMVMVMSENVGLPKRELEPPPAHSIPQFKVTTCPSCPTTAIMLQ